MSVAWYIPIGFLVGTYGTIIGAGGGFILVPLLMFLFPLDAPSMVTAASLAIIFVNSTSGTVAYAFQKRISYRTGILFAAATIPGALIGSWLTHFIPKALFGAIFGCLLIGVAVFLSVTRGARRVKPAGATAAPAGAPAAAPTGDAPPAPAAPARRVVDTVVDSQGNAYPLSYNVWVGMGLSLFIGCFSSLVGIGGGLIHVPVLTYLFGFPLHIATATSHFILIFTSLAGVVEHILDHTWPTHLLRDACLAVGVVGGAQLGAFLSKKIASRWIIIGLAVALGLVGVRLVVAAF